MSHHGYAASHHVAGPYEQFSQLFLTPLNKPYYDTNTALLPSCTCIYICYCFFHIKYKIKHE